MLGDISTRGHATIRDVAALAGVSVKSVSRVVNGEPGVSPTLSAKVTRAIDQLGYRHNLAASSLRRSGQRTSSIGVAVQDASNPFSAALLRAVEDVARQRGVVVLAASVDGEVEREQQVLGELVKRRVDGIILMPTSRDHSHLADDRRLGMHFVFVDRPPVFFDSDAVLADNRGGAGRGVAHLIAHGHRRIAFLGDMTSLPTARARFAGYVDALDAAGIAVDDEIVAHDLSSAELAAAATERLLAVETPPTAIFTAQNLITVGVLRVLRAHGLRSSIAHVGFDDVELADLLEPGLSVIRQSPAHIGRVAAELLFARLDGKRSEAESLVMPVELVERGSGELAPRQTAG